MKEHPVLFSGPMVRAILDDRKTQTRRLVKPQPPCDWGGSSAKFALAQHCPYSQPGDRLWVRETWRESGEMQRADGKAPVDHPGFGEILYAADAEWNGPWRPSIFMRRWMSRITLEITAVRVERLRDISEEDAKAEGMKFHDGRPINHRGWRWDDAHGYVYPTCKSAFAALWQSINGPESREANPWVWVIEFRRVRP